MEEGEVMRKSNCKHCKAGIVLDHECNRVVSKYYCYIDAYDSETGCTDCPYKKKVEVKE